MTKLLAEYLREEEAEEAFAAGAAYAGFGSGATIRSQHGEVATLRLDPAGWQDGLAQAPVGSVVILDSGPRPLLIETDFSQAERFARGCRERGLAFGFSGALEAPDVPRLLPLEPDVLGFREALRGERGAFDAQRCRRLVKALERKRPRPLPGAVPDRVFVRELVVEMEIGAYRSERGRRQRVRFCVEAQVTPPSARPAAMEDVFSYDRILDSVHALAKSGHTDLVETLAEDVASDLLTENWVEAVIVRVEKLDLGPFAAGVEIRRSRTVS